MTKKNNFILPNLKFGSVFKNMFGIWKRICLPLAGLFLIPKLILPFIQIPSTSNISGTSNILFIAIGLITAFFIYNFTYICAYKSASVVCKGKPLLWRDIFKFAKKNIFKYLATSIGLGLVIALSSILFFIPGIILALMYCLVFPIMCEENLKGDSRWKKSEQLMKGIKGKIFGYSIVIIGLMVLLNFLLVPILTFLSGIVGVPVSISKKFANLAVDMFIFSLIPIFQTLIYNNRVNYKKDPIVNEEKQTVEIV